MEKDEGKLLTREDAIACVGATVFSALEAEGRVYVCNWVNGGSFC